VKGTHRGKPSVKQLDFQPSDKVVLRCGSCSTEYVRRVSGDELFAFLANQECEMHDFLHFAVEEGV